MTHYLRALTARLRGLFGDRRGDQEFDDDLYRDEDGSNDSSRRTGNNTPAAPPRDPIARGLSNLISPNQLALINKLAKRLNLNPESACREMYQANLNEISRKAASALIERLNTMMQEQ